MSLATLAEKLTALLVAADLAAAEEAAAGQDAPPDGDHAVADRLDDVLDSDEGVSADLFDRPLRDAAVLVAFVDRPDPTILLTRRTEHLSSHAGQVAFPGGSVDAEDADIYASALREAREEIGLPSLSATIIGAGTPYLTGSGFRVVPVLAVIPPDLPLVPQEAEVAAIFEVRTDILFDPAYYTRRSLEWKGRMRSFYEISGSDEYIWGATAGMIASLGQKLGLAENPKALNRGA